MANSNAGCCGICKISVSLGPYLAEFPVFLIEEARIMHVKQLENSMQSYAAKIEDVRIQENGETSEWTAWVLRLFMKDVW